MPDAPAPPSEQVLLHALLEQLTDSVYFKDRASRFIRVNQAMARRLGRRPEEVIGRSDIEFFTPEHAEAALAAEQHIIATGEPLLGCEEKETWTDGHTTWVSTSKLPLRDLSGALIGTFGISRDITAHKQAEDQIHRNEANFRGLLAAAPIGISIVRDRVLITTNDMLHRISGYDAAELLGRSARVFYPSDEEFARVGHALYDPPHRDSERRVVEATWVRKDGTAINVELGAAPLDPGDPAAGMAVTVLDITERLRAAAERKELQLQLDLAHKLESIGRLAAGIAHELNTPGQFVADNLRFLDRCFQQLGRYLAAVETLRAAAADHPDCAARAAQLAGLAAEAELPFLQAELPRCIRESLDGMDRISRIVAALKDFSRPGASGRSPTPLAQLVQTTALVCRHEWQDVAALVTELDPAQPPVPVFVDEINQALLNLLVNAAEALRRGRTPASPPGRIVVRTRTSPRHALIEIEDNGPGIPASVRRQFMDPVPPPPPPALVSGQGLHLVHQIARHHGGRVEFDNGTICGTLVRLLLPLAASSP